MSGIAGADSVQKAAGFMSGMFDSLQQEIDQHMATGNLERLGLLEKNLYWGLATRLKSEMDPESMRGLLPPAIHFEKKKFTYNGLTNDFGVIIQELIFPRPTVKSHVPTESLAINMQEVAAVEGIALEMPNEGYYPRDRFMRLSTGEVLLVGVCKDEQKERIKTAIDKTFSRNAYLQKGAQFNLKDRFLPIGPQGAGVVERIDFMAKEYVRLFTPSIQLSPVYIEGGNVLTLTNREGQIKIFMGEDQLVQIHMQLRLEGYFERNAPDKYDKPLSDEEIKQYAEEMYALGILKVADKTGFVTESNVVACISESVKKENQGKSFRQILIENKKVIPIMWTKENIANARPRVQVFLAEREAVKQYLAPILKQSPENICCILQVFYHLDVFIKSGPCGSVFLQDFDVSINLLESIMHHTVALSLTWEDFRSLIKYWEKAKTYRERIGPLLQEVRQEFEKAGFIVIPTPGVFYDFDSDNKDPTDHFNLLNAISGWSPKNNRYFYITSGISVGNKLGSIFMGLFEIFLDQYQPGIQVHFVGHNKENGFSEAMKLWNRRLYEGRMEGGPQAGVHCLTFERAALDLFAKKI